MEQNTQSTFIQNDGLAAQNQNGDTMEDLVEKERRQTDVDGKQAVKEAFSVLDPNIVLSVWQFFGKFVTKEGLHISSQEDWIIDTDLVVNIANYLGEKNIVDNVDAATDEELYEIIDKTAQKVFPVDKIGIMMDLNNESIKSMSSEKLDEFVKAMIVIMSTISFMRAYIIHSLLTQMLSFYRARLNRILMSGSITDPFINIMQQRLEIFDRIQMISGLDDKETYKKIARVATRIHKIYSDNKE